MGLDFLTKHPNISINAHHKTIFCLSTMASSTHSFASLLVTEENSEEDSEVTAVGLSADDFAGTATVSAWGDHLKDGSGSSKASSDTGRECTETLG